MRNRIISNILTTVVGRVSKISNYKSIFIIIIIIQNKV